MKINSKNIYKGLIGLSVLMIISGWQLGYADNAHVISRDAISIDKVQNGDFSIKIEGYGLLQSINKRLLTATSNAVVDEIKLKAGAVVNHDTVILTLKNPELEGKLRQALAKLKNTKTQKRQIVLKQQREMLNSESHLSELQAQVEIAMLQVEAERTLAKSGIVSGINAKKNELKAKQLVNRVQLEKSKIAKLVTMQNEAISIQEDLIAQSSEEFEVAKLMVEQLSVTAGINGVIQRFPLNLGQSVTIGTELALIGSLSPLIAEIKVPQIQAHLVRAGMQSEIQTLNNQINGQVVRIDPVINEGAVQIDIKLVTDKLDGIKPMQQVDATIFSQVQTNTNYIKTPTGVNENSTVMLYKLTDDNKASQVEVQFGKTSGQLIQIISGLKAGDKVITSRLDLETNIKQIKIGS
ncbi:HlyD family efflux transporter periplasmic adaptor subunit [Pseudoalteromonas sp. C2R02]|uniref:efflux RND transporter periplasmic adaptor subunit n=1 Tax=Pseudoalteromonas sp. C2R02 TaxID=2841565 RepID=UPI001C0A550E|nr:HlyD family efflux transporter periplasmic adaptor subunit [Pseudoalteromonas sp. C2R02]MBU2971599.1 HlyD family efflux transporter periplasmic adaptor subunit [Pseudoalteromonas sp. C2R02]